MIYVIIYYDSYCQLCINNSKVWKKLDWLNKLDLVSFRTLDHYPKLMEEQIHVYSNGIWYVGFCALIQIAKMLPLLWPLLPIMYMVKWIGLGDFVYKKIAQSRTIIPIDHCDKKCLVSKQEARRKL